MSNHYKPLVDIIMPTYNNHNILSRAVISLFRNTSTPYRLFIVNNGDGQLVCELGTQGQPHFVKMINMEKNEGWMGGINGGIDTIEKEYGGLSEYVLFCNDDVRFLDHHNGWLMNMINIMRRYPKVGAVGPASNNVLFLQSLNYTAPVHYTVPVLSGFCMLTRKSIIQEIGGLDETLFGGDDLDYSMRIRDAGYELICCRRSFVYHEYGVTGKRLHKDWDNSEWAEKINQSLIKKHGLKKFKAFQHEMNGGFECDWSKNLDGYKVEATVIKSMIGETKGKKIVDLGCGGAKICDEAIGVDIVPDGEFSNSGKCEPNADVDIVADITKRIPFNDGEADVIVAKHVLEHITDYLRVLDEWKRILKHGGKIILAVPDPDFIDAINCDPTHVHAFTKESVKRSLELLGFHVEHQIDIEGGWSHVTEATKEGA